MEIPEQDISYIKNKISTAEAVLVLGAGAVRECMNARREPLRSADQLAEEISAAASLPYSGEPLPTVLDAAKLPTAQFNTLLVKEYMGCTPSDDLKMAFSVPWRRVYTFNIDDAIEALGSVLSKQNIFSYNAMHAKVAPYEGPRILHVVHLNGYVRELDKGAIFAKVDYDKRLGQLDAGWYREAAEDHFLHCSIFIGTRLNEPLLWTELERVRESSAYSRSFLIIPEELTAIQRASLANRGVTVIKGTFEDFVRFLRKTFPQNLDWADVVQSESGIVLHKDPNLFSRDEVEALASARLINPTSAASAWRQFSDQRKQILAREFYMGRPATWEISISEVPAPLAQGLQLREFLEEAVKSRARFAVVTGQAGCGKSTAVMRELLLLVRAVDNVDLIEISMDVVSLSKTIRAARKFSNKEFTIFFVPDLYPFGGAMKSDIQQITPGEALIVTTSRESEWHGNFKRHLGGLGLVHEFKRFSTADEPELINRLVRYVPSPAFAKLTFEQKLSRLRASRRQLLIALREVTESSRFDEIMRDEYVKLNDFAKKTLFGIAAVSSLARTGIRREMAYSTFQIPAINGSFEEAFEGLAGLVFTDKHDRLSVRHDVYGRYILEEVMPFVDVIDAVTRILTQFTKYKVPIIRSVPRLDAALFKFLLNHNFIYELAQVHGVKEDGLKIYQLFEIPFQIDGHFWLQYGLYYDALGRLGEAESMLRKSIQAYPENAFAEHALARLRLRIAARGETNDLEADRLIGEAVSSLNALDVRDPTVMDEYPVVTLSIFHLDALLKRGKEDEAKVHARDYLSRLKYMERRTTGESVKGAIEQLTIFLTTGDWRTPKRETIAA